MRTASFLKLKSFVSVVSFVSFVGVAGSGIAAGARQPDAECRTATDCRDLTLEAIAAAQYQRAHDLAWRVIQLAPRNDPDAMTLLARAQSLSGRGADAFVTLQRLAAQNVAVPDVETSDDFRRVREYPQWPALQRALARAATANALPSSPAPEESKAAPTSSAAADSKPGSIKPKTGSTEPSAASTSTPPPPATAPARPATRTPSAAAAPPSTPDPSAVPPSDPAAPAPPAAPSPGAEATATPAARAAPEAREVLSVPVGLPAPAAIAYDAVSARFVVADAASDVLRVLSESSGNATTLVSRGWSGHTRVTAVAINRRSGDLWVASHDGSTSALHRFQLVSGRLLHRHPAPDGAGDVRFVGIAVTDRVVYALDEAGRRIFALDGKGEWLRSVTALPEDIEPLGLAAAPGVLYVSHRGGMLRVNTNTRRHAAVTTPAKENAAALHSLAWHDSALVATQELADGARVLRLRLNARGTAITAVETLGTSAATAAAISNGEYYFVARRADPSGLTIQSVAIAH